MVHKVTLIRGDGTGPELAAATRSVLDATGVKFEWDVVEAGVDVMKTEGTPLPAKTLESLRKNGLGLKAPTGSHTRPSQFYTASGPVDFPADQTIQPGDGGWAILTQVQAFRQLSEPLSVYGFGSYMISPRAHTSVVMRPGSQPDQSGILAGNPDVAFGVNGKRKNIALSFEVLR